MCRIGRYHVGNVRGIELGMEILLQDLYVRARNTLRSDISIERVGECGNAACPNPGHVFA